MNRRAVPAVLAVLRALPEGEVVTYGELALEAGYPGLSRAVGSLLAGGAHDVVNVSQVHFRALEEAEIRAYWRTGEPADKAGAYAVQGLAAAFIERIEGSYSGIMGLPLFETAQLLDRIGWTFDRVLAGAT